MTGGSRPTGPEKPGDDGADGLRERLAALDALHAAGDLTDDEHAMARRLAIFRAADAASPSDTAAPTQPSPTRRKRGWWAATGILGLAAIGIVIGVVFTTSDDEPAASAPPTAQLAFVTSQGRVKLIDAAGAIKSGPGIRPITGIAYTADGQLWMGQGEVSGRGYFTHGCNLWSYPPSRRVTTYTKAMANLSAEGTISPEVTSSNLLCFPKHDDAGDLIFNWYGISPSGSGGGYIDVAVNSAGKTSGTPGSEPESTGDGYRVPDWGPDVYFTLRDKPMMGPTHVTRHSANGADTVVWPRSIGLNVQQVAMSPDQKWLFARAGELGCGTCTFDLYKLRLGTRSPIRLARNVTDIAAPAPPTFAKTPEANASASEERAPAPAGDIAAGETLFATNCGGCHPSGGRTAGVGPQLEGVGLDPSRVRALVINGRGAMPGGLVSGTDLTDVVAYVQSLQ